MITVLRSWRTWFNASLVSAYCPNILPQPYGTIRGEDGGVLVPPTRRCPFCAIFACYAEYFGRNDTVEDTRGLGEGGLCLIYSRYTLYLRSCNVPRPHHQCGERLGNQTIRDYT